jgi:rSAM/selenodomain-associated transferase 2
LTIMRDDSAIKFSIVVPVLNEGARIAEFLTALRRTAQSERHEIIVVDGGSSDDSVARSKGGCDRVLSSARGRAVQQNAGAACAKNEVLLFVHADTRLPADALKLIDEALASGAHVWGRFDVAFEPTDAPIDVAMKCVAFFMNLRSRWSGIATGDQCLFVRRDVFNRVGGFAPIALMEDIELCKRLKRESRPACLRARVTTSAQRWQTHGVVRTILLMWWLRLAYWLGASPARLAKWYGYVPNKNA